MRTGAILFGAILLVACEASSAPSPAVGPEASGRASIAPAARSSASAPAEPSPLPAARPGVRATAAGALPGSFRYVALDAPLADGARTRLWLVDLGSRRIPMVVAEWEAPAAPVGGYSSSADGRILIVSATGTRSRVALYLVRPETGETKVLFEDPAAIVLSPRISPDGSRYAFTTYPADGGSDLGIWAGRIGGGETRRISDPSTSSNVPQLPLAWSADSAWLAFTRELERAEVHVVAADGGKEIAIGAGDKASWRTGAPELLVADSVAPTSRIYTADLATGKTAELATVTKLFIPSVEWRPSGDRFVYVASENAGREASGGIWMRNADGSSPTRVDLGRTVFAPQWSRDGALLSALGGGDDARITIVDLLSGRQLSVLCRRGGTPPADCL